MGYLRPFVPGQHVQVKLVRNGHVVTKMNPYVKRIKGRTSGPLQVQLGEA